MEKLSAQKVLTFLAEIPPTLMKLAEERDAVVAENVQLRQQLIDYQVNERVEKVAHEVHAKGIEQGRTMDETREFLLQKAASGELDVIEQAVGMTAASTPLGHVGDAPTGDNDLEAFVLS